MRRRTREWIEFTIIIASMALICGVMLGFVVGVNMAPLVMRP